ncbi:MAG: anaerobic ribonucleoside-triphosphate reductase activating protein [Lachnospiraceae bacterium]|nr:anaerobic ribonucleoside-triphosphate reductase activating protein [Lachnospiraceae bacterium]
MINLFGIAEDSIVDGPGIRTVFFAQGCPHHCKGCHNPESWPFEGGTAMDEEQLVEIARSNPLSRKVTFSGGEPFAQAEGFAKLAELLRPYHYEIASFTGYTFEYLMEHGTEAQKKLLSSIDVLIDGPFIMEEKSLELYFKGSRNQRVLDVKKSLAEGKAVEITAGGWVGEY